MTVVAMSHGEISRFDTLMSVERGDLRVDDAAVVLGSNVVRYSGFLDGCELVAPRA